MAGQQAEELRRQAAQRALVQSAQDATQVARDRLMDKGIRAEIARQRPTEVEVRTWLARAARAGR